MSIFRYNLTIKLSNGDNINFISDDNLKDYDFKTALAVNILDKKTIFNPEHILYIINNNNE